MTVFIIVIAILIGLAGLIWLAAGLFMGQRAFGRLPGGERLERVRRSPHYREGQFRNIHLTPNLAEGVNMFTMIRKFFFEKHPGRKPPVRLPSVKTDLLKLDRSKNCVVWFGHSSYFIQADGKRILVDPVLSGAASPIPSTTRSFAGSDIYAADELPDIDYLIITHDHWDHLDYQTVTKLRPRVGRVITSLGTAAHLEFWGYDKSGIVEEDWDREVRLEEGFVIRTMPARHFAGRTFRRNRSFWMSVILQTPRMKLYLGGDSGYDDHFADIGERFGPFDLAILECGQYNPYWKYIHMMPEEMVQAGIDLRAAKIMPVHWGKFSLSMHPWDEPIRRAVAEAEKREVVLVHPMIGDAMDLPEGTASAKWWESIG